MKQKIILLYMVVVFQYIFMACYKEPHDYKNHRTAYFHNTDSIISTNSEISCITFNIQLGFTAYQDPWDANTIGADSANIEKLAEVISQFDADIIALQEIPRNRQNTVIKNFVETLAARLKMNYAFGAHGYNDAEGIYPVHGEWGNAILTKFKIQELNNIEVSRTDEKWRKRSMLHVLLKINDKLTIAVGNIHYGLTIQEYEAGIINTKKYLQQSIYPVILMGDFNPQFGIINLGKELKTIGLVNTDNSAMRHSGDNIFVSSDCFTILECQTYSDTLYRISDHPLNYSLLQYID